MMNTYGAIDNLAHIWCAEMPVTSPSGQPLNRNDIGFRPKSKKVRASLPQELQDYLSGDRKSAVEGKSVSVRVDLGGRRIIKKKPTTKHQHPPTPTHPPHPTPT